MLQRNEYYYRDKPKLAEVTFLLSGGSPMSMYENGELDIVAVGPADVERVRDPANALHAELTMVPQLDVQYIGFDVIKSKEQFSKIVRMPEGEWKKLIMSGNCIEHSVFEDAFNNPMYHKVRISLEQALKEKRYTQKELDEKKSQTTSKDWKRYYEVEFPQGSQFNYFKPKVYNILPKIIDYYGAVDLALGETGKGSLVGINVIGKDEKGQFYQIESIGEQMTPDDTMVAIFNLPYSFKRFGIEAVQFQKYFLNEIEKKSKEIGRYIPFEGIQKKDKK